METKIIKRGLLFKKGHVVKNWKQRIFVLAEGSEYMYYYKDEKEESLRKPSGQIPLFEAKVSKSVATTEKRGNLIEITTITERNWLVSADNEQEKESWLEALKIAIEKCPFSLDSVYYDSESRNREINKMLKESRRDIEREIKLLLLGPGDAGKSTFVKQMKLLHLNGYSKEELMESRPLVYHNLLFCLKALIYGCQKLEITITSQSIADEINDLNKLTEDIIVNKLKDIKLLWEDAGIQEAFAKQYDYQLPISCSYWMANLDRIGSAGYIPTQADILRTRVVTTGIVETVFSVENVPFRLVDVGGQRAERKKWIHCFQDVTAVIFLIAINEYDLKLVEDESVNRMHESMQLWSDICKEKWLKHIPIIVFLNKSDLFKEKIAKLDMSCCFPEYTGGCNYDNGIKFLEDKIVKLNPHLDRPIYTYVTCATDTENIKVIFATVKSIVLQQILDDNDF